MVGLGFGAGALVVGLVDGLAEAFVLGVVDGLVDGFPLDEGVLEGLPLGVDEGVLDGFPLGEVVGVGVTEVGDVPGIRTPRVGTPGPIELTARTRTKSAVLLRLTV